MMDLADEPAPAEGPILIMLPLFNDWESLGRLLVDLDAALATRALRADVLIVDDGSTSAADDLGLAVRDLRSLGAIDVLALRRNLGHQRAIAIGLAYVEDRVPCRVVVVMDSDGEDAPGDVPRLLQACREEGYGKIVFAARARRSETPTFRVFYFLYKLAHRLLTGSGVRVGNFSAIPRARLESLVVVSEMWNHYAAAAFKSRQPICTIPTRRASRLSGRSRMNFVDLVVHGLSAISVHGELVGVRLLVAAIALILATAAGVVAVVLVRLATPLAIPGWATYAAGILTVLMVLALMLSLMFCFVILSGRQGGAFLPRRDYAHYVGHLRSLRVDDERL